MLGTDPSKPFGWFFPEPQAISSHTGTDQTSAEHSGWGGGRVLLHVSGVLFVVLPFSCLCQVNSGPLGRPRLSALTRQLMLNAGLCLNFLPCAASWKLSKYSKVGQWLLLISHGSLSHIAWCPMSWEPLSHKYYMYFFIASVGRVTRSWPEEKFSCGISDFLIAIFYSEILLYLFSLLLQLAASVFFHSHWNEMILF